ncbi:conserved hypothetical protein [Desulfotalea psychrophila LSv54]|uniref:Aminoglycoside phosphotransferase domain-containing protein n=2 Tax=Desulfotalea psychrophila TaxID=84980 RepID=Q6ALI2_DESPS|nr:conserved hypothetical protein [Desulfotalea psychrophila LSv54]
MDETRIIAKFYRPGRWSIDALRDEHRFMVDCATAEIPVVLPLMLANGETIDEVDGFYFSLFPKKAGREFEVTCDEDWRRIGQLIGRIHLVGSTKTADDRIVLHPSQSTVADIAQLVGAGFVSTTHLDEFIEITGKIVEIAERGFKDIELIRIHSDCHSRNILNRPEEGLMIIDFDDMVTGPPVQDIWLLLHDYADRSQREINLILEGYEQFREFDDRSLKLIEPLRAMRMLHHLAWCSKQVNDFQFNKNFPDWGSDAFWQREISDLRIQLQIILEKHSTG